MKNRELEAAILSALALTSLMPGESFLTRSVTVEQINERAKEHGLQRVAEVANVDEEARTVELAFSSEAPVLRWFGEEILDHSEGAMRSERLAGGAAVLVNHDWDDQVGVVESFRIDKDRKGRAVVRFGKGARASEIFQDVVDGIRKHVSVGYSVHKIEVEERKGQPDLVRVIDWEPFEISLVSVPADPTVGVGRSMENTPEEKRGSAVNTETETNNSDNGETIMLKEKTLRDAKGNLVRAKVNEKNEIVEVLEMIEEAGADVRSAETRAHSAERDRVNSILRLADKHGQNELARKFIEEGKNVEDFRAALLDKVTERGKAMDARGESNVGLSDNEVRQYSFLKVVRALANPTDKRAQEDAAFEFEASRAAAKNMGREAEGIVIPTDVLSRALNTSTTGTAAGDTGGYSVATELMSQSFIDILRNRSIAMQVATTMGGLVGNLEIPRQSAGATGYWIGEDGDATEDNLELDQIGMSPKTVAAFSEITRRLLMQSSLDVEALVRRDLAAALALTIDKAAYYGSGASNQPRGIANYTGINAVDFGTDGAGAGTGQLPTYAEIVEMETEVSADNADAGSLAYVLNSRMRGHLKTTQKFANTNGSPVWEQGNTVNGYNALVTNQINNGDVIFGNWSDLLIGMWGGLELTADPYTHSTKGRLRIVAMQDVDVQLRRLESFCLGRDSTA